MSLLRVQQSTGFETPKHMKRNTKIKTSPDEENQFHILLLCANFRYRTIGQCRFTILISPHKKLRSEANDSEYKWYTSFKIHAQSIGP